MKKLYILDNCTVDLDRQTATINGEQLISLSPFQCTFLSLLINSDNKVVPHEYIQEQFWGERYQYIEDKTYSSAVTRLRQKLNWKANVQLINVRSSGYRLGIDVKVIEVDSDNTQPLEADTIELKNKITLKTSKLFISIATIMLASTVYGTYTLTQAGNISTSTETEITPLSYIDGVEFRPSISPDGNYMAFSHTTTHLEDLRVKIKDLNTNEVFDIPDSGYNTSPMWGPKGDKIYYASYQNGSCLIKSISAPVMLQDTIQTHTTCGQEPSEAQPQIDANEEWLYFPFKEDTSTPYVIKRFHLETKREELISTPTEDAYGDYSARLSPSGHKLAVINTDASFHTRLTVFDLNTGDKKTVYEFNHILYNVAWGPNSEEIYYVGPEDTIYKYHLTLDKHSLITKLESKPLSIDVDTQGSIYVGYGNVYSSNIYSIDLNQNERKVLVYSTFNDNSPTYAPLTNTLYFISDRSGRSQIWMAKEGKQIQLTNFEGKNKIEDLGVSNVTGKLSFLLNGMITQYDPSNQTTSNFSESLPNRYRNLSLGCNGQYLYASRKSNHLWSVYKVDLTNLIEQVYIKDATGLQFDCETDKSYYTKENSKGLYLTNQNEPRSHVQHMDNLTLTHNDEWSVSGNTVLFRKHGAVYNYSLDTKATYTVLEQSERVRYIHNDEPYLLYSRQEINNTYIAKISTTEAFASKEQ